MGASPAQIKAWKKEYGKVFATDIFGQEYIFRALTYHEFDSANLEKTSTDAEDMIISCGLLSPDNFDPDSASAGVASTLAEEIIEVSCFTDPKRARQVIEDSRVRAEEVWNAMKTIILVAMPTHDEQELNHLTFREMADKVTLAESIIKLNQSLMGMEPSFSFDITDPEEQAEQQQKEALKHNVSKKPGQAAYDDPIAERLRQAVQS